MTRLLQVHCELDYQVDGHADFIFNIEAAHHSAQTLREELLTVTPATEVTRGLDPTGKNRLAKLKVHAGPLKVVYDAVVEMNVTPPQGNEQEMPIDELPVDVVPYIWASRYCESDAVGPMVVRTFGGLPKGYSRVQAICDWIRRNIHYQPGSTGPSTSTRDVLVHRAGVCRDFAHLAITFCRALNMPARFVTGYTWYRDPPPDFHAIFEVYLEHRWVLFDATELAPITDVVRIATGRDAADTAFATIFGPAKMVRWSPEVKVLAPA